MKHWHPEKITAWKTLEMLAEKYTHLNMTDLFSQDSQRAEKFSIEHRSLFLDFSKNKINPDILSALTELAKTSELKQRIGDLFSGKKINRSEDRPALHVAMRTSNSPLLGATWQQEMQKITTTVNKIRNNQWSQYPEQQITDIINIGVGGSDLGPRFACDALKDFKDTHLNFHFIANIDPHEIQRVLKPLNPKNTLFILCSKSFTTLETQLNYQQVKHWQQQQLTEAQIPCHWLAVTHHLERARAIDISEDQIFYLPESIGGRYSITSSMGITLMLQIGMEGFQQFLAGAYQIDQHFQQAPFEKNMPVILALLSIWYQNFLGARSHGVVPYDENLNLLLNYLQQLDMESNGKSCDQQGHLVDYTTGVPLWGGIGSNSQHSFHQLLHQGTLLCPVDFLLPLTTTNKNLQSQHQWLVANCLAQSQALMLGQQNMHPEKIIAGNKPSNMICYTQLTPETLGSLIALYEHKIFTQSVIWQINPFDQWGVELGKSLAKTIYNTLENQPISKKIDSSTQQLINHYHEKN